MAETKDPATSATVALGESPTQRSAVDQLHGEEPGSPVLADIESARHVLAVKPVGVSFAGARAIGYARRPNSLGLPMPLRRKTGSLGLPMPFEIAWNLNDHEWERARKAREEHPPDSEYDAHRRALYYLFNGDFDIRTGTGDLYGSGMVNISLLDFAHFAARVLGARPTTAGVSFDQLDDDRHIRFDFSTPSVRISADDSDVTLEAPRGEVLAGLRQFLVSFAHGIDQRAPRLFDWRSMDPLVGYRSA